jgi:hypothetical protein
MRLLVVLVAVDHDNLLVGLVLLVKVIMVALT